MSDNENHNLPDELHELECQLRELTPASMPGELTARIEQSISTTITSNDHDELTVESLERLEIHLEQMAPATMPADLIDRMVRAMDNWHERVPVEEKLVPFADRHNDTQRTHRRYGLGMLSLAAVVTLLGAITALVFSGFLEDQGGNAAVAKTGGTNPSPVDLLPAKTAAVNPGNTSPGVFPILSINALQAIGRTAMPGVSAVASTGEAPSGRIIGESLEHKVTNTSDEGVVMAGDDNTPHRCIRVEYLDLVTVEDKDGRQVVKSRPGVKYVLLPVEIY